MFVLQFFFKNFWHRYIHLRIIYLRYQKGINTKEKSKVNGLYVMLFYLKTISGVSVLETYNNVYTSVSV